MFHKKKQVQKTPEELIRQNYIKILKNQFGYPFQIILLTLCTVFSYS